MRSRMLSGVASAGLVAALGVRVVGAARPFVPTEARAVTVAPPRFEVVFPATARQAPLTGRLIVILSKIAPGGTGSQQRVLQPNFSGPAIYGVDLEQLRLGQAAIVDQTAIGYPGVDGGRPDTPCRPR